jgi:hypothetical protein
LISNHDIINDRQKSNLALFSCTINGEQQEGNILLSKNSLRTIISKPAGKYILVLEFELHDNISEDFNTLGDIAFVNFNPLYDMRGMRLINLAEFEL